MRAITARFKNRANQRIKLNQLKNLQNKRPKK